MRRGVNKIESEVPQEVIQELQEMFDEEIEKQESAPQGEVLTEQEEKRESLFEQKPSQDLLSLYLQEMDERSLFTPEEEVEKARQVQELRDRL